MPTGLSTFSPSTVLAVATALLAARSIFRDLIPKITGSTNVRCVLTGSAWARTGLRENLSDRRYPVWHQKEMLNVAETRVAQLKKRGYANAGIYNPQGVGGTHVMYVLHHADQPSLYHNLPDEPKIAAPVNLWKGILKPLSAAGFIATFAGLIYHYVGVGPNKETDDDEEENGHE